MTFPAPLQLLPLLQLLQLASPALPVGAYSYSEGLETLCATKAIASQIDLQNWLRFELEYGAIRVEAALMVRAWRSASQTDLPALIAWNHWLTAARETEELRASSCQMGDALLKLMASLTYREGGAKLLDRSLYSQGSHGSQGCNFAIAFGICASLWEIDQNAAVAGYMHSWAANLIGAGVKLIPLGQTAGQQLLSSLFPIIYDQAQAVPILTDDDLYACGWGLSLASMNHETLYSRLFRS